MSRFRRPSPAVIIATIALGFAVTGSAVAAGHLILTSTKQISPKVLRALKGRRGAKGARGARGAIGPIGPVGRVGAAGTTGTTGAAGVTGVTGVTGPAAERFYGEVDASGNSRAGVNFESIRLSTGEYQLTFPLSILPSDVNSDGSNACPLLTLTPLAEGFSAIPGACTYLAGVDEEEEDVSTYQSGTLASGAFDFIALPNH